MTYVDSQMIHPERYRRWHEMKRTLEKHRTSVAGNWLAYHRARKRYVDWLVGHGLAVPADLRREMNSELKISLDSSTPMSTPANRGVLNR